MYSKREREGEGNRTRKLGTEEREGRAHRIWPAAIPTTKVAARASPLPSFECSKVGRKDNLDPDPGDGRRRDGG